MPTDDDRAWAAVAATLVRNRGMSEEQAVAQVQEWRTEVTPVVDPAILPEFLGQVANDLRGML